MMSFLRLVLAISFMISFGYFGLGIQSDKGLILGLWNPATILKFTEIPIKSTSNFKNISLPVTPSGLKITSMVSDPERAVLFIAFGSNVYMVKDFSIMQKKPPIFSLVYTGKSSAVGQIAFDYLSKNLYWCDSFLNWIAMKPAYNADETIQKVVVQDDLNYPHGLTLDPEKRLIFFSDNGLHPRIERASLDGQDRKVIVYRGLLNVVALSVDTANDKLYWSDFGRQTLEVSDYDGSNRRVIIRINGLPFIDLFYYENLLYVVNREESVLKGIDPSSGIMLLKRKIDSGQPYTVNVYDTKITKFQKDNPCSDLECDHMCVNTKPEPKCMCADGFTLDYDDETCTERNRFFERGFLVNNESMFVMHEVHSLNGQRRKLRQLKMFSNIETVAVDAKTDVIYFLDSRQNSLKKLDTISIKTSSLTSSLSGTDLTFDWIENRLGWIEAGSRIKTYNIKNGTSDLIYSNFQNLSSLTIDAHNSALYWISGPFESRSIVRGSWKRDTPIVLISEANLHNPVSLRYDVSNDRLYWLDGSQIKSSMTNGLDIRSHILAIGALKTFAYKEYFGWITEDKIYFARQSLKTAANVFDTVKNAKEVVVFDSDLQKDKRGSCHIRNGGCEDFCIPSNTKSQCKCDIGLKINGSTCNSDILREGFIIVTDFTHERLLQIGIQNGSVVKVPINVRSPGVAVDKTAKFLYFTDIKEKTIQVSTIFGKNTSTFYATGFEHADRIAIDHSTGNVYYSAIESKESKGYIRVVHKTASLHKTVLSQLLHPRDIVLHPSKGFLFWTEFNDNPSIGRACMDGTARTFITTKDLVWPNGLAIDFESNLLYWTDGYLDRIEVSDLYGGNRRVLATDTNAHLMSIGIHGQHLYYTAWNRQRITKMDKTSGSKISFMNNYPEFGRIDSMDIFAEDTIDVSTSCSNKNGFCSTFCFPTPSGRTCGCQDNVSLQSDQLTCQGVLRCSTSHQNLMFLDCLPYPGQSCAFKCNPGYRSTVDTTISCLPDGHWAPSIDTVCEAVLCPSFLDNAILSSACLRRPGDSCSFSCAQGYSSSTTNKLVCTSGGLWNRDHTELCSISGCKSSIENGQLVNCESHIGESCHFVCNPPYEINPSVTELICNKNGVWNHDTHDLCVSLCPPLITNGRLAPDCSRQIGTSCSFTCDDSYKASVLPRSITCSSGAVWNKDVDELCIPIKCPLEIPSGRLSSVCRGLVGEICALHCDDKSMDSVHVVCLPTGLWDMEIGAICIPGSRSEKEKGQDDTGNNTYLYVGALISGAIVIILFLLQNRRH